MSDAHAGTAANHPAGGHAPAADHDDHAAVHGDHDDGGGGHDAMHLGGIAWDMWLVGILGVALGLVVVFVFVLAGQGMPAV